MSTKVRLVLLGAGHTHAGVLARLRRRRWANVDVICVSDHASAAYSGMLPGVLGGQYERQRMEIDLAGLCDDAGASLVVGTVQDISREDRVLVLDDGRVTPFDILSIGVGSVPQRAGVQIDVRAHVIPTKPMQTLIDRLDASLRLTVTPSVSGCFPVAVVGGGLGGVEIACALTAHIRSRYGARLRPQVSLLTREHRVLAGLAPATARRVMAALSANAITVVTDADVNRVAGDGLHLTDGRRIDAALTLWATGAVAPPILQNLHLPQDDRGFLLTDRTLLAHCDPPIFAVGDAGTLRDGPAPKAGVYAVRQTPILWHNLGAVMQERRLRVFTPQSSFLRLINIGANHAIGEWKGVSFEGRWAWRLKDYIDRRFMAAFDVSRRPACHQGRKNPSGEDERNAVHGPRPRVAASLADHGETPDTPDTADDHTGPGTGGGSTRPMEAGQ